MSSICKLSISGIRSFGAGDDQVIAFFHPLTVIVGPNGCGKTTIIECLRYATTGTLPPNSKAGQAFIHDPKITGASEVKAKIEILLRNRARQRMYVGRNFKLTQRRTKLEFKALDGVIKVRSRKTGEEVAQTHRCADLDKSIPGYLGVSKAILENVIFCHQEESNWPLQEGAVLKKKFDDIFESTRYTKALLVVRKQRKETLDRSKDCKRDFDVLAANLERANELIDERDEATERLEALKAETGKLEEKCSFMRSEAAGLRQQLDSVVALRQNISQGRVRLSEMQRMVNDERAEMEDEFKETTEDLHQTLQNADKRLRDKQRLLQESKENVGGERKARDALLQRSNELAACKAKLETEEQELDRLDTELGNFVNDALVQYQGTLERHHQHPAGEAVPSWDCARDYLKRMEGILKVREGEHATLEARTQNAVDNASEGVNRARHEQSHVSIELENSRKSEASAKAAIRKIVDELSRIGDGAHKARELKRLEEEISKLESKMKRLQDDDQSRRFRDQIEGCRTDIASRGNDMAEVSEVISRLEEQQEEQIILKQKRDAVVMKSSSLVEQLSEDTLTMRGVLDEDGAALLDSDDANTAADRAIELEECFCGIVLKREDQHNAKLAAKRELGAAIAKLTGNEEMAKRSIDELRKRSETIKRSLPKPDFWEVMKRHCGGHENFTAQSARETAAALDHVIAEATEKYIEHQHLHQIVKAQLKKVVKNHECPVCYSKIKEEDATFSYKIEHSDESISDEFKLLPGRLKGKTFSAGTYVGVDAVCIKKLQSLKPKADALDKNGKPRKSWDQMMTEKDDALKEAKRVKQAFAKHIAGYDAMIDITSRQLPEQTEGWKKLAAQKKEKERAYEIANSEASAAAQSLRDTQEVRPQVEALARLARELQTLSKEVEEEEQRLGNNGIGAGFNVNRYADMGLDEARAALRKLRDESEKLQQRREELSANVNRLRDEEQNALAKLNELKTAKLKVESENQRRQTLTRQKKEHEVVFTNSQRKAKELAKRERELKISLRRREDECKQERERSHETLSSSRASVDTCRNQVQTLNRILNSAQRLLDRRVKEKLADVVCEIEEVNANIDESKKRERAALDQVSKIEKKLAKVDSVKASIQRELRWRHRQEECEVLKGNIEADEESVREKAGDAAKHEKHLRRINEKLESSKLENARLEGQKSQVETRLAEVQVLLKSNDKFRNIAKKHREKMIEYETTVMAVSDLDKYYKALDAALMQFHSMKIKEINSRIRELWQLTYRGGDIDRIELRSDPSTTSKGRSYNYRVVMTKGETDLDMRGRCSAGQKVLASLVIRLALAETFSVNCGILALDEPTTNLDHDNRQGFAKALGQIIASRQSQQLIVITHDEDFVDTLAQQQVNAQHYFRVSRTRIGNGKYLSKIDRHEWGGV